MTVKSDRDRRAQILDAAEEAFASHGFEGASLRQIVTAASVNLATVYYYFQSKEGLFKAVFERRFEPLRQQHLQLLHEAQALAEGKPLPLTKLLEILIVPPLCHAVPAGKNQTAIQRMIGRLVFEPNRACQEMVANFLLEVQQAMLTALRQSLPSISEVDLCWRWEFLRGAIAFVLCNPSRIETLTHGVCNLKDPQTVVAQMLPFFSAGFQAARVTPPVQPQTNY